MTRQLLRSPALTVAVLASMTGVWACKDSGAPDQPTPVPTTLTLSKTAVSLDAIGATDQLSATVRDQNGNTMSTASVSWASNDQAVATVSASGLVAAVANGTAQVTATSGSANASATVTVAQVPAQVQKAAGDAQTGTVGQALTDSLYARVNDRLGNAISGVTVNFAVSANGGVVSPTSGAAGADGRVGTEWTLGTLSGSHSVTATPATGSGSADFTATADPEAAAAISEVSGSGQTGLINTALANPLVVAVVDQFDNGVPGVGVTFSTSDGLVSPTNTTTDASGQAQATWTLGSTIGAQTAQASSPGLTGDPVTFTATGTDLSITTITPDTIVEGASATITGTGFDAVPANNTVTVDGAAATVTTASATSLTITVPSFNCQPLRDVDVQVTVGGTGSNTLSQPLKPDTLVSLAVGEMMLVQDPNDFCLQFAPSSTGGDAYAIGVGAAAETPTATVPFTMTTVTGAAAPGPPAVAAPLLQVARRTWAGPLPDPELVQRQLARLRAESRIREWERQHLDPARNPGLKVATPRALSAAGVQGAAAAVPNEGDTLLFHVPNVDNISNQCDSIHVTTVVRKVGKSGIFVTDTANPTDDSLTIAEIQAYSDTFDILYDTDTLYFGPPSDLDANGRVFVVLTIEVNKLQGGAIAGFVFSGDLFDPASCETSDQGEIFYGHVPDPNNVAGAGPRSKAAVLGQMATLIAHEFTHNIQFSRRLVIPPTGAFLTRWEAEGQATFAEEVVGHSMLGTALHGNHDRNVARSAGAGAQWYEPAFRLLAYYYGWDGAFGKAADAPEDCTLFGQSTVVTSTCNFFHFYGSSYSFQRFVADHYGPGISSGVGGEAQLHRDWLDANPLLNGVANVEALLGVQFDSVFARWGAMLYADDRVTGVDSTISMLTWDMFDIFSSYGSERQLVPPERSFALFTDSRSVRGGSTAYTRISSAGAHPAVALRVRDGLDAVLGTTMKPQLWIVRLQ